MAKRTKFNYNPDTLSFEKIETSIKQRFKKFFMHTFLGIFIGIIFFFLFVYFVPSPKQKHLENENEKLELQYKLLSAEMATMQEIMQDIEQRDDNLYRVLFQAEPLNKDKRRTNNDNDFKYKKFENLNAGELIINTSKQSAELKKQLYAQSKSFDEIIYLAKINEKKLQHIPAIQPILNQDLSRIASGFGYRVHPIYHTRKMHHGMDFTAPTGTDIYATGNGTIIAAEWKQGYGNTIIIDHGFGYKTVYAHLHKYYKHKGEQVKRGDIIAAVGSTGISTAPHLHYEVKHNDTSVNPMNYYFLDLSPEEYDKMIRMASNAGRALD